MTGSRLAALKPWAGLLAGLGASGVHHQLVSDALHFDCSFGRANTLVGVAALLVIALGAWWSWRALRAEPDPEASARFVARMSLMTAAVATLFVGWMMLAGWILPACVE